MDLQTIRAKVRTLIGDSSYDETALDVIINRIYQRSMPLEFRLEALESEFEQVTSEGTSSYTVDPDTYLVIREPVYLDGAPVSFYRNKTLFYLMFPKDQTYTNSTPSSILYNQQTLILMPPPDKNGDEVGGHYKLVADTILVPTALSAIDDTPLEELWGAVIAADAAIDILMDTERQEEAESLFKYREFHASKIRQKELMQFVNMRGIPAI